jgi:tRNA(Ile)-lysidine synthase
MIQLLGKVPNNIYVAVSGGPDSMAVLDFLNNGKRTVSALYFNHCTDHGYEAKKFVRNYCMHRGIGLLDSRVRTKKPDAVSWEEFWRNERYKYFKQHSERPIVTGHHLNDVVEWWLMSSMHGEAKIIPHANDDYNIIRPFLLTSKKELVDWCDRKGVPYLVDPSNESRDHMRNVVRHDIMPHALKVNPGIEKVMKKRVQEVFDMRKKLYKTGPREVSL